MKETMNRQEVQTSMEELFAGLTSEGRYSHLKLFLSRKNEKHEFPMYFLWISRTAFGKVLLDDIDFDGTQVHLSIEDCTTGFKKVISIDIDYTEFQFILISWNDIRNIVMAENKPILSSDELLDFE